MTNSATATQPARPPLYHYSDGNGFIGMLTTARLWFTHIKYLNDAAEYSYALNLLANVLEDYRGIGIEDHLLKAPEVIINNERLQSHYSFSLTEEKDLLSQWRGYCPTGGYSFAISGQQLDQMSSTHKLAFQKCLYKEEEQRQFIIDKVIGRTSEQLKQAYEAERESKARGTNRGKGMDFHTYGITNTIIANPQLLAFLKDPAFKEEKEWRIVASEHNMNNPRNYLKYRSNRNLIIPYLDLPILASSENGESPSTLNIEEVVLSPTPHKDLALASCRMMMDRYQCHSVHSSSIPYRNW